MDHAPEMPMDEVEREIARGLSEIAAAPARGHAIGPGSRLYHDLGLTGDDLHEAVVWFSHRFRVDVTGMDLRSFAPGEGWRLWEWPWPFPQKTYRELTVRDLAEVVRAGSWEASRFGRHRA